MRSAEGPRAEAARPGGWEPPQSTALGHLQGAVGQRMSQSILFTLQEDHSEGRIGGLGQCVRGGEGVWVEKVSQCNDNHNRY